MTGERRQQFLQHFGRRVRAARILRGTTLQECAAEAGMSYSNLLNIERGKRSMYVEHLPHLAQALGVSASYLVGDEGTVREVAPPPPTIRTQEPPTTAPPPTKRQKAPKAAPVG